MARIKTTPIKVYMPVCNGVVTSTPPRTGRIIAFTSRALSERNVSVYSDGSSADLKRLTKNIRCFELREVDEEQPPEPEYKSEDIRYIIYDLETHMFRDRKGFNPWLTNAAKFNHLDATSILKGSTALIGVLSRGYKKDLEMFNVIRSSGLPAQDLREVVCGAGSPTELACGIRYMCNRPKQC